MWSGEVMKVDVKRKRIGLSAAPWTTSRAPARRAARVMTPRRARAAANHARQLPDPITPWRRRGLLRR